MPVKNPVAKNGEVLIVCPLCGKKSTKTSISLNHYQSKSKWHSYMGKCPMCKECMRTESVRKKRLDIVRLVDVLRANDRPYHPNLIESAVQEVLDAKLLTARKEWTKEDVIAECGGEIFGHYMKDIGMQQYREEGFRDSTGGRKDEDEINIDGSEELSHSQVGEMRKKYGYGFDDEDYISFENKYNSLLPSYPIRTDLHREALKAYVVPKCLYEKALSMNDMGNADKYNKFANEAQKSGKLNVSSLSKSDVTGGVELLAQMFEAVELENGAIDIIPEMLEKPDDSIDLAIHSILAYGCRLEGKPVPTYKEIYGFYGEQLEEFFESKGWDEKRRQEYRDERSASYRDLVELYEEPMYEDEKQFGTSGDE